MPKNTGSAFGHSGSTQTNRASIQKTTTSLVKLHFLKFLPQLFVLFKFSSYFCIVFIPKPRLWVGLFEGGGLYIGKAYLTNKKIPTLLHIYSIPFD